MNSISSIFQGEADCGTDLIWNTINFQCDYLVSSSKNLTYISPILKSTYDPLLYLLTLNDSFTDFFKNFENITFILYIKGIFFSFINSL